MLLTADLSYLQSVVMGALQGVAELFPISSLGHSVLVPSWLGWNNLVTELGSKEQNSFLAYIVALHVATAFALVAYYWRDWVEVVLGVVDIVKTRSVASGRARLAALLIIATIPVGIIGLVLDKSLRHLFDSALAAAIFLTINGLVLLVVERLTQRAGAAPSEMTHGGTDAAAFETLGFGEATAIGTSQALALLPGISRSGVTISAGLLRGLDHSKATHFAFLLATPVILGAGLLKIPELFKHVVVNGVTQPSPMHSMGGQIVLGAIVAFVAAYASVAFLARYMKTRTLYPFVAYCLVVGGASIIKFA